MGSDPYDCPLQCGRHLGGGMEEGVTNQVTRSEWAVSFRSMWSAAFSLNNVCIKLNKKNKKPLFYNVSLHYVTQKKLHLILYLKAYAKQPATLRSSTCSSRNTVFINSVYSMPMLYICLQVKRFCCSDSVCSTKKDAQEIFFCLWIALSSMLVPRYSSPVLEPLAFYVLHGLMTSINKCYLNGVLWALFVQNHTGIQVYCTWRGRVEPSASHHCQNWVTRGEIVQTHMPKLWNSSMGGT